MPSGLCVFNDRWLDHKEYREWVQRDATTKHKAYFRVCKKSIDLSRMGESALSTHHKGKKHLDLLKASKPAVPLTAFLTAARPTPTPSTSGCGASATVSAAACGSAAINTNSVTSVPPVNSAPTWVNNSTDVLKAEILWTLKAMNSHYSFKSCEDNSTVFSAMFPGCPIAQAYKCGEKKTSYLATFGIAPHFHSLLSQRVKAESSYVLLFDETLNNDMQEKQLDIHVRIWEGDCLDQLPRVGIHGTRCNRQSSNCVEPIICSFGHRKLLQLSIDGPSINWKMYRALKAELKSRPAARCWRQGAVAYTFCTMHSDVEVGNWMGHGGIPFQHVQPVPRCSSQTRRLHTGHRQQHSSKLLLASSTARQQYQKHLEGEKKAEAAANATEKRKLKMDTVTQLKAKKARIEEDINHLQKRADKLCEEAEHKNALSLLSESNALRKRAKDKEESLPALEKIEVEMVGLKDSSL